MSACKAAPSAFASCKPCSKESSLPSRTASRDLRTAGKHGDSALSNVSSGADSFFTNGVTISSVFVWPEAAASSHHLLLLVRAILSEQARQPKCRESLHTYGDISQ